jgi:hypothetical protein
MMIVEMIESCISRRRISVIMLESAASIRVNPHHPLGLYGSVESYFDAWFDSTKPAATGHLSWSPSTPMAENILY